MSFLLTVSFLSRLFSCLFINIFFIPCCFVTCSFTRSLLTFIFTILSLFTFDGSFHFFFLSSFITNTLKTLLTLFGRFHCFIFSFSFTVTFKTSFTLFSGLPLLAISLSECLRINGMIFHFVVRALTQNIKRLFSSLLYPFSINSFGPR